MEGMIPYLEVKILHESHKVRVFRVLVVREKFKKRNIILEGPWVT